jgi:hypothetical protein
MPKTHPKPRRWSRLMAVAGVIVAAIVALFVFLDVADIFRFGSSVSSTSYATKADLIKTWDKSAPWLPNDATDIWVKEIKRYGSKWDPAIIRTVSHRPLNPALCTETNRLSSPVLTASWSPDANISQVYVCSEWDVIPTSNGWFGWTLNSPQEQTAAAALLRARATKVG